MVFRLVDDVVRMDDGWWAYDDGEPLLRDSTTDQWYRVSPQRYLIVHSDAVLHDFETGRYSIEEIVSRHVAAQQHYQYSYNAMVVSPRATA